MKNFKKFTAFVLTLCMLFSLSVAVFAAEADEHTIYDSAPDEETAISTEAATSGTIQNSGIRWELDNKGWLTISGSGEAPVFQSADDQPWAAVRDQITEVWFEDVETLTIPDLAYWFEGCTALTTAELPLAPVIGRHAFYNCPKLSTLTMYYGETVLNSIGEDAFWREADSGDTLYIAYIIGYPEATVPFYTYDWAASNRSNRYFYDLYGVYPNADTANTAVNTASVSGIQKAPGISLTASTGIVGTCPSCKQYSLQGTYVSTTHTSRGHAEYYECYKCHYTKNLGTYVYKDHGSGSYGSWTCPDCGSHTWVLDYEQDATCTRNGYREYSCDCGQSKRETIYATGHSYSYGSWEEYSSSQHRREAYCRNCGDSDYEYASHIAIFMAMFLCLVVALGCIAVTEQAGTSQLAQNGAVNMSMAEQAGGNMEGKETRFGIAASSTWAAFTTAASNGSVNSMHDSYTPLAGMVTMLLMQLGEVIFGGVGCGLYGMLAFAILAVFIAGLMVGRTPEFLGKKIEPYEMKWSVLVCLATPIAILVGSGLAAVVPSVMDSLHNGGAHGFSEMLYAYSSCGGNNGSAFAGFNANTVFLNVSLGLVMLFARFLPIIGTLAIAGSLAGKKKIATTAGTLSTTNGMFVFLLIVVVLLIGALSFFPALALGPLAEFFGSIA